MKLAMVAADFTPEEANGLRRAMATFRNVGTIDNFRDKMIGGMVRRGYQQDFAERCFKQIEGFGSYGFPESHAQSFARLVYVRSEEHTSELQSLMRISYAVFCLKKKKKLQKARRHTSKQNRSRSTNKKK